MEQTPFILPQMLAPFYKRLLNWFTDLVLIFLLTVALGLTGNYLADAYGIEYLRMGDFVVENSKINFFYLFCSIMFYGLFESYLQRTPGKFLTGTRVIRLDGAKPTEWNILLRTLLRFIPFEALSFMGAFPIGFHDSLSRTLVIDIYKYERELQRQRHKQQKTDI